MVDLIKSREAIDRIDKQMVALFEERMEVAKDVAENDLSVEELKSLILSLGEKPFRAGQIFRALSSGRKISEITDISLNFRNLLLETYVDEPVKIINKEIRIFKNTQQ